MELLGKTMLTDSKETEILNEIRISEKESETIVEKAEIEKQKLIDDAKKNSSKLLAEQADEAVKNQEKKLTDARDKAKAAKDEQIKEGEKTVKQISVKAEKNVSKAIDFIMKKFEAAVTTVPGPQNKNFEGMV
jgi:V/A-type H+-transporting ATPase subunit G/H